jgi:hypothetical protein
MPTLGLFSPVLTHAQPNTFQQNIVKGITENVTVSETINRVKSVAQKYTKRDTLDAPHRVLNQQTASTATVSIAVPANSTATENWRTALDIPGLLDWNGGVWTWRLRVVTANADIQIDEVQIQRRSSDGLTLRASKSSGPGLGISCGTTGVKSGTITWDDGTQNPAGRAQNDRIRIQFTVKNTNLILLQTLDVGANTDPDDRIDTPLLITEGARSLVRSLTETDTISEAAFTRVKAAIRTKTETDTIGEAIAKVLGKSRAKTETDTIGEALAKLLAKVRSNTEIDTITEDVDIVVTPGGGGGNNVERALATETIVISETGIRQANKWRQNP